MYHLINRPSHSWLEESVADILTTMNSANKLRIVFFLLRSDRNIGSWHRHTRVWRGDPALWSMLPKCIFSVYEYLTHQNESLNSFLRLDHWRPFIGNGYIFMHVPWVENRCMELVLLSIDVYRSWNVITRTCLHDHQSRHVLYLIARVLFEYIVCFITLDRE